jgi:hypothetical protein
VNEPKDIDEAVKRMGGATPEVIRRNIVRSIKKLKMPSSRQWPDLEAYSAAVLRERIGQVRCIGNDWYVQNNGFGIQKTVMSSGP